jgi:hypothetical protein
MLETFLTHAVARETRKSAFFFSRFNFQRMKECGNTHYCFYCGGRKGFTPDAEGKPTNHIEDSGYDPMKGHDASHDVHTIANADKYQWVHDWLSAEIAKKGKDFAFIVSVPSIM